MEQGFFHPERGYWQATGEPSAEILTGYPVGTVSVPLKPGVGYTWDGVQWIESIPADPEPPAVPRVVTARQAWQALIKAGLIDSVQPAIDAIEDPVQRRLMDAEWNKSQEFHRDRPALIALATAIGLTSEQLDNLFIEAAQQ